MFFKLSPPILINSNTVLHNCQWKLQILVNFLNLYILLLRIVKCYIKIKVGVNVLNYKLLGNQIRKYRKQKKYTLEQLAEKLDVSTTFIGQIERAKGIPSLETLVKIANELEVSTDCLLFGDLNTKSSNNYFIEQIDSLTETYTPQEKELLLKNIELLNEFKAKD